MFDLLSARFCIGRTAAVSWALCVAAACGDDSAETVEADADLADTVGQEDGSAATDSSDDLGGSDSGDGADMAQSAFCPTPNPAFLAGCEPVLPNCDATTTGVMAESFRGTFGSVGADGSCQSEWPDLWLANCTEPLPPGVPDLRGLWADEGHVERVEQCGNLVIIVGDNYTHGGYATGLVEDGVNDVRADGTCEQPIQVALRFVDNALQFVVFDNIVVTRTLEPAADGADELVWRFGPGLSEVARMRRYCSLADIPPTAVSGLP